MSTPGSGPTSTSFCAAPRSIRSYEVGFCISLCENADAEICVRKPFQAHAPQPSRVRRSALIPARERQKLSLEKCRSKRSPTTHVFTQPSIEAEQAPLRSTDPLENLQFTTSCN